MRLHLECIDWPNPDKDYQPEFSVIQNEKFEQKRIHVDNHQYGNCRFLDCTFVYSGGPFGFHDCEVEGDFYLAMTGAARRASELLQCFQEYDRSRPKPLY